MTINFNVTGARRKELVSAIASKTGFTAKYLGVPGCAYGIGPYTVDRTGGLTWTDAVTDSELEYLVEALCEMGFEAEVELPESSGEAPQEERRDYPTEEPRAGLAIQMPLLTESQQENLRAIIAAKASLLKKTVGTDDLSFTERNGKLDFPWFKADASPEEIHAYMELVTKLCELAKNAKRVTAKDRETGNDKYAFRCFLLRLGFIGDKYKADRKVLLKNLSGNSAFKADKTEYCVTCRVLNKVE